MLCSYFNKDGEPLESSPEYTLRKACQAFTTVTGMEFQAMGELEYYVISENDGLFPATDQRGYHESALMPSSMISVRNVCHILRRQADR